MNTSTSDTALLNIKKIASEQLSALPMSYDRHEVTVDLGAKVLTAYKRELFTSWSMATQIRGVNMPFSEEELGLYIDYLVVLRVDYVNGKRVKFPPTSGIAVPSFLSCVLSNLGMVKNLDLGLELYPTIDPASLERLTLSSEEYETFMFRLSGAIKALANLGIEYADGYLRSRDGSYEFMSMALVDGFIRNVSKEPHPVFALLASTLGVRGIEAVLSPRINYGTESHMVSLVRHLAATKG